MGARTAGPPAGKLFLTLATAPGDANVLASLKQRCGTDGRPAGGKTVSHISNCSRRGKCARPIKTKMRHGSAGPPAGKLFLTLATAPGAANVLAPLKQRCVTDRQPAGEKTVSHIKNCTRRGRCARPIKTKMRHGS